MELEAPTPPPGRAWELEALLLLPLSPLSPPMHHLIRGLGSLLSLTTRDFYRALDHPLEAQRAIQRDVCDRLIGAEYGQAHGIRSVDQWNELPIVDYEDIRPWVERQIQQPRAAILTPDPMLFCEKTSGSRGAAKVIPYTRSLRQSFSQMFCIWAADLIRQGPPFSTGKVYFCVSPKLAEAQPASASLPALQDDSDYLDGWLKTLLRPFWVSLPHLGRIRTAAEFKHALCLRLLQEERLEILSLWSPSFLTVHLDYIESHRQVLLQDLGQMLGTGRGDRHRLATLQAILHSPTINWTDLWPQLKLISCWDSAAAADQAAGLRSRFPGVLVQGKGLLATEAPMTVPLIVAKGYVPLLNQVFFEFEDAEGQVHLLHELTVGEDYEVILSQKGGFYRYRMGDRVRVTPHYRNTPCLEFLGRSHSVSDLVGEKLHEDVVKGAIASLGLKTPRFICLMPVRQPQPHYVLLLDQAEQDERAIAQALELALQRTHHYQHARLLGQLAPAQVRVSPQIPEQLTQMRLQRGQIWGDMKHPLLETQPLDRNHLADSNIYTIGPHP